MITDYIYKNILRQIHEEGDLVETRNHLCKSCFDLDPITLTKTPLVTVRKTAWRKALQELEWFMSGDPECPTELLDWWKGQLDNDNCYHRGYSEQLRWSEKYYQRDLCTFDQIHFILSGLKYNPNSRRLILTTWNPWDMAHITELNNNKNTPSTCHGTLIQYFVRGGQLHAYHYQRSADVLLGLPHNLIQHWALLLYFAKHSKLKVGSLRYQLGDAHIYQHKTHIEATEQILKLDIKYRNLLVNGLTVDVQEIENSFELWYNPDVEKIKDIPVFKSTDFTMTGIIPNPRVTIRPVLL